MTPADESGRIAWRDIAIDGRALLSFDEAGLLADLSHHPDTQAGLGIVRLPACSGAQRTIWPSLLNIGEAHGAPASLPFAVQRHDRSGPDDSGTCCSGAYRRSGRAYAAGNKDC